MAQFYDFERHRSRDSATKETVTDPDVTPGTLAERLGWIVDNRGFRSDRALSDAAGLAPGLVSLYRSGKRGKRIAVSTARKIAEAGGVSLKWLLGDAEEPAVSVSVHTNRPASAAKAHARRINRAVKTLTEWDDTEEFRFSSPTVRDFASFMEKDGAPNLHLRVFARRVRRLPAHPEPSREELMRTWLSVEEDIADILEATADRGEQVEGEAFEKTLQDARATVGRIRASVQKIKDEGDARDTAEIEELSMKLLGAIEAMKDDAEHVATKKTS